MLSSFTPPHSPRTPAASAKLYPEYSNKCYQHWHNTDNDNVMNCARVCFSLVWHTTPQAQNGTEKLNKSDSHMFSHAEILCNAHLHKINWGIVALSIIILFVFSDNKVGPILVSSEKSLMPLQSILPFSKSIFCILSARGMSSTELQTCVLDAADDYEAWSSSTTTQVKMQLPEQVTSDPSTSCGRHHRLPSQWGTGLKTETTRSPTWAVTSTRCDPGQTR